MPEGSTRYLRLFSPIRVGNQELRNRLVMAPLYTGYATREGRPSSCLLDHYRELGKAGLAMVVVENVSVSASGLASPRMIRAHEDAHIEDLSRIAGAIHEGGALACCQINHPGRFSFLGAPVAPSPVELSGVAPRELATEEIQGLVVDFAATAKRVKEAGFDMVELHGGTGYLLSSFVSARTNRRTDDYGGSREARMRFPLEVLAATLEAVGPDFPVGYRFLAHEWLPDGFRPPEDRAFAQALEKAGVAYLSVMGGTYESFFLPEVIERSAQDGYMVDLAAGIKPVVSVPVVTAGRIARPSLAERILQEGQADLIGLARVILADPEWVRKARSGDESRIVHCRTNCDVCMTQVMAGRSVICAAWPPEKRAAVRERLRTT